MAAAGRPAQECPWGGSRSPPLGGGGLFVFNSRGRRRVGRTARSCATIQPLPASPGRPHPCNPSPNSMRGAAWRGRSQPQDPFNTVAPPGLSQVQRAAFFPSTEFCKGLQGGGRRRGRFANRPYGSGRPQGTPLREGMDYRVRGNDGYGRLLCNPAGGPQQGRAAPASPRPHPNPLPAGEGVRPCAASLSQGQRAAFFPSTEFCKGLQGGGRRGGRFANRPYGRDGFPCARA